MSGEIENVLKKFLGIDDNDGFVKTLKEINDINCLFSLREYYRISFCSIQKEERVKLIDHRLAELLPEKLFRIFDIEKLFKWWDELWGQNDLRCLIEKRMVEILNENLNDDKITWLVARADSLSLTPQMRQTVLSFLDEHFEKINKENIPQWFIYCIKENKISKCTREKFLKKAVELFYKMS